MKRAMPRLFRWPFLGIALLGVALAATAAAHEKKHDAPAAEPEAAAPVEPGGMMTGDMMQGQMMSGMRLMMPRMDPVEGRKLFVSKGCIACHAINGVGGHDAANLDAHSMDRMMNPFDFAAKMWRMAPAMIYAQEEALGEQILFTGDELASIVAFVHSDAEQHKFTEADLTPTARMLMHHSHGEPGRGPKAHAEELGHMHGEGGHQMHQGDQQD